VAMHVLGKAVGRRGVRVADGGALRPALAGTGAAEETADIGNGDGADCARFAFVKLALVRLSRFIPPLVRLSRFIPVY